MGSSRRKGLAKKSSAGASSVEETGARMAGDILSGVNTDPLESQETADENIMDMSNFNSPTEDSLTGGFLQKTNPTVGGSYLGQSRQSL